MNKATDILVAGAAIGGGFFSHRIRIGDRLYGVIVAPKADGEFEEMIWNKSPKSVSGAESYFDGRANTSAMAEAGSKIASQVLALRIGGYDDWHIPARDALEGAYRALKPSKEKNAGYFRSGDNPSSVPAGYPYTPTSPTQTDVEAFRAGGPEAFEEQGWYWTSAQSAGGSDYAWIQYFGYGFQGSYPKSYRCRVRAVRLIEI